MNLKGNLSNTRAESRGNKTKQPLKDPEIFPIIGAKGLEKEILRVYSTHFLWTGMAEKLDKECQGKENSKVNRWSLDQVLIRHL